MPAETGETLVELRQEARGHPVAARERPGEDLEERRVVGGLQERVGAEAVLDAARAQLHAVMGKIDVAGTELVVHGIEERGVGGGCHARPAAVVRQRRRQALPVLGAQRGAVLGEKDRLVLEAGNGLEAHAARLLHDADQGGPRRDGGAGADVVGDGEHGGGLEDVMAHGVGVDAHGLVGEASLDETGLVVHPEGEGINEAPAVLERGAEGTRVEPLLAEGAREVEEPYVRDREVATPGLRPLADGRCQLRPLPPAAQATRC